MSTEVNDTDIQTWNYRSGSTLLLSFAVYIVLQSPVETINDIKNNLNTNSSNIIPPGLELKNERFMILAFKPSCECLHMYIYVCMYVCKCTYMCT